MATNDFPEMTYFDNPDFTPTCAGNACDAVSYRYNKGNYFKNNSDKNVVVILKNWAASNTLDLSPGEEKKSFIDAFENPYQANYK